MARSPGIEALCSREVKLDDQAAAARMARTPAATASAPEGAVWAGIAIVAIIVAFGVFLIFRMIDESRIEDCLLAHRHNCDALLDR
jgi:hypothetical protein